MNCTHCVCIHNKGKNVSRFWVSESLTYWILRIQLQLVFPFFFFDSYMLLLWCVTPLWALAIVCVPFSAWKDAWTMPSCMWYWKRLSKDLVQDFHCWILSGLLQNGRGVSFLLAFVICDFHHVSLNSAHHRLTTVAICSWLTCTDPCCERLGMK